MICCNRKKRNRIRELQLEVMQLRLQIFAIESQTSQILELLKKPSPVATQVIFYNLTGGKKEKVTQMKSKVTQKLPLSVEYLDAKKNPALVEGAPSWALTDESLGSLVAAEDGMTAEFTPAGPVGSLKVQVTADADLGEGVKTILGEMDLDLIAGDAVSVSIKAGEPVDA